MSLPDYRLFGKPCHPFAKLINPRYIVNPIKVLYEYNQMADFWPRKNENAA